MTDAQPTIVFVHGAFAESASWAEVIENLQERSLATVAVANPLRSVAADAAYVRDVIAGIGGPVVLVGHSYGGMVITQAAANNPSVIALVYVAAFAAETGESAIELSAKFPGSTLGDTLVAYPLATGGNEFAIRQDAFHHQFVADTSEEQAAIMAATQRPITEAALAEPLPTDTPAWHDIPAWFVFGDQDLNIPVAVHRFLAERAGSRETTEITGASHAISVSHPEEVSATILAALSAVPA